MVSYLDMAMVSVVPGIAVEYSVFNRVTNVGYRRGGGSARKISCLPKYLIKHYIAFTSPSPSLPVFQCKLARSQQYKDYKF
jgi:hypothetical protein